MSTIHSMNAGLKQWFLKMWWREHNIFKSALKVFPGWYQNVGNTSIRIFISIFKERYVSTEMVCHQHDSTLRFWSLETLSDTTADQFCSLCEYVTHDLVFSSSSFSLLFSLFLLVSQWQLEKRHTVHFPQTSIFLNIVLASCLCIFPCIPSDTRLQCRHLRSELDSWALE